ncbi:MAG: trypsin-like serine protease [Cyanobacteriota bacterium]|nr:trypsin-like serine protease [Cyanobacteriota bacterium]
MKKTIVQKILSLFLCSLFITIGLGNWMQIQAQEVEFSFSPIEIPLNPETDGSAFVPDDREISQQPYERDRAVIGEDDRLQVTTRKYPWSTIGRLEKVDSTGDIRGFCTGTLIGIDLVLTNAHCLIDRDTKEPTSHTLKFRPSFLNGRSIHTAEVASYKCFIQVRNERYGRASRRRLGPFKNRQTIRRSIRLSGLARSRLFR